MKNVFYLATISILLSGCVIKKDSAASASAAVSLSKKFSLSMGNTKVPGSADIKGAVSTPTCTLSGSGYICKTDTFESYYALNGSTLTGYQKYKGFSITDGAQSYAVNGQLDYSGSYTFSTNATFTVVTVVSDTIINGTINVSGSDAFSFTYKEYKIKSSSTVNATTLVTEYSYACSGAITIEGIDYKVKADCSIDA